MSDAVLLDVEDGVATLTMNQPDRMNPVTGPISEGIENHLDTVEERDDVRCVVVEGAGGAFSAGGDIQGMKDRLEGDESLDEAVDQLERGLSETMVKLVTCTCPTVAKVDGPAVGAGANLAIGCDVVLASDSASIGFVFNQVGLSVDGGTSYLLPRVVGVNKAKELVFTGEILGAAEADNLGLFNHVYADEEFEDQAGAMVDRIASGPTVAYRQLKQAIRQSWSNDYDAQLDLEAKLQGACGQTRDFKEGVVAFLEKRPARYEGR
mgnify:CR=1 FL=1